MKDYIGTADMSQGSLTSFTTDRFGNANSALALNGGYTIVPSGVYFDSLGFTIAAWVYPQSVGSYSRILDFGNGPDTNNVVFSLSDDFSLKPYVYLYGVNYDASKTLILNTWQHLAVTFDANPYYNGSTYVSIYQNGLQIMRVSVSFTLPRINRINCYIGKSNWADCCGNGYSRSYMDELRIYNTALSSSAILALYSQGLI